MENQFSFVTDEQLKIIFAKKASLMGTARPEWGDTARPEWKLMAGPVGKGAGERPAWMVYPDGLLIGDLNFKSEK